MKPLEQLVRISRWRLDEKRQKLTDLERLSERLRADLDRLEAGLAREKEAAQTDDAARQAFPAFLKAELERKARLEKSIGDVEREVEAARDDLTEAFRELKKYELAKESQDERARRQEDRAEQAALDELGTQLHRRRNGERGTGAS